MPFLDGFPPPLALKSLIYHFIPFWMTMGLFCLVLIVRTAVVRILKGNARRPTRQRADKGAAIRAMARIGFLGVAIAATLYWTGNTVVEATKMTPRGLELRHRLRSALRLGDPIFSFSVGDEFFHECGNILFRLSCRRRPKPGLAQPPRLGLRTLTRTYGRPDTMHNLRRLDAAGLGPAVRDAITEQRLDVKLWPEDERRRAEA